MGPLKHFVVLVSFEIPQPIICSTVEFLCCSYHTVCLLLINSTPFTTFILVIYFNNILLSWRRPLAATLCCLLPSSSRTLLISITLKHSRHHVSKTNELDLVGLIKNWKKLHFCRHHIALCALYRCYTPRLVKSPIQHQQRKQCARASSSNKLLSFITHFDCREIMFSFWLNIALISHV